MVCKFIGCSDVQTALYLWTAPFRKDIVLKSGISKKSTICTFLMECMLKGDISSESYNLTANTIPIQFLVRVLKLEFEIQCEYEPTLDVQ